MQAFEKHKGLSDSILFGAHNWKISTGWTNHLEQINKVCEEYNEMVELIKYIVKANPNDGSYDYQSCMSKCYDILNKQSNEK